MHRSSGRVSRRSRVRYGDRVQVNAWSGLDSGKIGRVIRGRLDHRGIPITTKGGNYNPFRPDIEAFVETTDGEVFVMFLDRLRVL